MGQIFSNLWRYLRPKAGEKTPTAVRDDQPNQVIVPLQHQSQSHCIDISDLQPIPGSSHNIIENDSTNLAPEAPYVVLDLRSVDQKNAKAEEKEPVLHNHDENVVKIVVEEKILRPKEKIVKVTTDLISVSSRRLGPYNNTQKLLLVGEGDFSFSASLAGAFGSASNMIATSLNSEDFLMKNYRKFPTNRLELQTRGCIVIHDVDATKLVKHSALGSLTFDRIVFNFPHVGKFGRSEAEIRQNKNMIRGFIRNAKKMINEDGEIHVTHKSSGFFLQWDIPKIGSDQGLHLIQEVKFKLSKYPGYHTKYGFGGDKDFDCNPSKTYKFGLPPK